MTRSIRIKLVWLLMLSFGLVLPTAGHETDQFTIPADREFADLGGYINRWMYGRIEGGVEKTNAEIRRCIEQGRGEAALAEAQSADTIVRAVNGQMPWAMDVIEGFEKVTESRDIQRRYPGQVVGYKQMFNNILQRTHLPVDPRQFFRLFLGSTLKVYGTYLGTDKIGHFTDMGMNYYRSYSAALRSGQTPDQAHRAAIETGTRGLVFSESGMLGYLTAGAYSNGDLAANYLGFLFYRNLTEPVMLKGKLQPPMLVRDGPYWKIAPHVRRDSDFFAIFVSDHFDEALNPSLFESGMRPAVRRAVQDRSALVLQRYSDERGNPRPREYFEKKVIELSTYYGADYGHQGTPEQLVSIANACFDAAGQPQVASRGDHARPMYLLHQSSTDPDARGRTALHWAARSQSTGSIAGLLEKDSNVNATDNQKQTPLHYAALGNNPRVAAQLIERGADLSARDSFNATPLHLAAGRRDASVARLLLQKGASASAKDDFGCTPLHDAAQSGGEETVALLLAAGAQVDATDAYGCTPLHLACRSSRILIVQMLLEKGADARVRNAAGSTPLHEAALAGDKGIIRLLLSRGADREARNRQGRTPADVAAARGYDTVVNELRRPAEIAQGR